MTTFQQASESGLRAAGHDRTDSVAILHDAAARWRREPREPDRPEFLNVIDIGRARRDARQEIAAPDVMAETRPDAAAATAEPLAHWAILLAGSALLHVALYLPFWREPAPMASIGLETITVDIVLGTDEDAGQGRRRGRSSLDLPAPVPAEEVKDQQEVQEPPTEQARADAQPDAADATRPDTAAAPDTPAPDAETAEAEQQPGAAPPEAQNEVAAAERTEPTTPPPSAPVAPAQQREEVASIQLLADTSTRGEISASVAPATMVTAEEVPDPPQWMVQPPAKPKPMTRAERKKEAQRKLAERREAERKHRQELRAQRAAQRRERGADDRARVASAAPASVSASSVGRGRSDATTNYRGIVAAHLARYKQFPADARSRRSRGRSVVKFGLNAAGAVTSVQLVTRSGSTALDQETLAMVRRASPFPAPPNGRAASFTVPVSFRIQ